MDGPFLDESKVGNRSGGSDGGPEDHIWIPQDDSLPELRKYANQLELLHTISTAVTSTLKPSAA